MAARNAKRKPPQRRDVPAARPGGAHAREYVPADAAVAPWWARPGAVVAVVAVGLVVRLLVSGVLSLISYNRVPTIAPPGLRACSTIGVDRWERCRAHRSTDS